METDAKRKAGMITLFFGVLLTGGLCEAAALTTSTENRDTPIQFDDKRKVFLLKTDHSSYAFGLDKNGLFVHLHWGGRVEGVGELPAPPGVRPQFQTGSFEYPANAEGVRMEPCIKLEKPDKLAHLKLTFVSHAIRENQLEVVLKAEGYPFSVILHYRVYPEFDLIDRWVEVKNEGAEKVSIENLQSAILYVPHSRTYRLTHLSGSWGKEWQVFREIVGPGERVFESRNGVSGPYHVPYFALDEDGVATEKSGTVWFGTLQWSGDWKMIVEQDPYGQVHVSGGYNDYDFTLELAPHESHRTPVFTAGFTRGGFGEASRLIHRYQKKYLYPPNMRDIIVPTVYNTYASIHGDRVTEQSVMALIPPAAQIGAELFIIDEGWQTAIGEWTVDQKKFPKGLKPVIDEVHRNGMKFGLWIEPERVMHNAKLFGRTDEWLFAKDAKSAMLNLSRRDVLEYVYQEMSALLRENDIRYLKLDFNRYFEIPDVSDRRAMRVKYVENFYELFERLQKAFPNVFFENCASGSGRPDLKMDTLFARINRSDNQDTVDCIVLQEGFTYLHPAYMAGGAGHISYGTTRMVNGREGIPFDFMAHVGMMGWLATSLPLDTLTPEQLAEVKGYFDLFKELRPITCRGELHRIASLREHPYAAFQFVLPDASESLLFVFGHGLRFGESIPNLCLESLDADKTYAMTVYGKQKLPEDRVKPTSLGSLSGRALMEIGVPVKVRGDYDSCIYHFKAR